MDDFSKSLKKNYENLVISNIDEISNADPNLTGSYILDYKLGTPFPEGGIVEIFGPESSMKTTLSLSVIAQALKRGKHCAYINMERSINQNNLLNIKGLRDFIQSPDTDKSLCQFFTLTTGEAALNLIKDFVTHHQKSVVVLDSVDACIPEALLSETIGSIKMGNHAKLMSDALRKLVGAASDSKSTIIFINQIRSSMTAYGSPNATTGGASLRFYAHQRIELLKPGKAEIMTDVDGNTIGTTLRCKIAKNKFMPSISEAAEIPILYNYGVFDTLELVDLAVQLGLLTQGGKGGKQINMPSWDITNSQPSTDTKCLNRIVAGRFLLLDSKLTQYFHDKVTELLKPELTNKFLSANESN